MTDPDPDDIDAELEAADSTALLAGMLAELKQIRWELQHLNDQLGVAGEDPEYFECSYCGETVAADERRDHLEAAHNAPESVGLAEAYETVPKS